MVHEACDARQVILEPSLLTFEIGIDKSPALLESSLLTSEIGIMP